LLTIKDCGIIRVGKVWRNWRNRKMPTVTISMPESLKAFVEAQVETRGYGNVSEYFRELLRSAQAREADRRLEALLLESLDTGEDIPVTREFWQDLKAEAARLLKERAAK
jgi:antitoxin ParD1/3/4